MAEASTLTKRKGAEVAKSDGAGKVDKAIEIFIDGKIYDVTGYKKHPGGSIIKFMNGTDGSDAFRSFHARSQKAKAVLKTLPNRQPKDTKEAESFTMVGDQALLADYRKLEAELREEGFYNPNPVHVAYRISELFVMHAVGFYVTYAGSTNEALALYSRFALMAMGMLLIGVGQGRCGWLMHEGGHLSLTGNMKLDVQLQEFLYGVGCGMAGSWWRNQHNKHHATPQKMGHDVDLDTLPLVAFNAKCVTESRFGKYMLTKSKGVVGQVGQTMAGFLGWEHKNASIWGNLWFRHQGKLFSPITCMLVSLFWSTYLHPRHALRTKHYMELFWMAVRYVAYAAFAFSLCGWTPGFALMWYLMYVQLGASYIFTNFAVSHTHLDVVGKEEHRTWAEYSCEHTMNCSDHWFTNWWMAYLNFQIEHHLFPQMPQYRFPQISPRVRAMFEKHGKEYQCKGYFDALSVTFENLNQVAQEALSMGF